MLEVCGGMFRTVRIDLFIGIWGALSPMSLFRFWRTFWIDATTAETIELSLRDIATDPDARASGVERSAKSVLQWLSRTAHDWLVVFDNASDDDGVAKYIPQGNGGNILFSS